MGKKVGYYLGSDCDELEKFVTVMSNCLFNKVVNDEFHVLHKLLPPRRMNEHCLRERNHPYMLPIIEVPHDGQNFFIGKLYSMMNLKVIYNDMLQYCIYELVTLTYTSYDFICDTYIILLCDTLNCACQFG